MNARKFLAISFLVFLAGCGPGKVPSESDVQKEMLAMMPDCKYMTVENVKKSNGIPQEDGTCLVKATFDVKFTPLDDNATLAKIFDEQSQKYHALDDQMKADHSALMEEKKKDKAQRQEQMNAITDFDEREKVVQQFLQIDTDYDHKEAERSKKFHDDMVEAGLNSFDNTGTETANAQEKNLNKECRKGSPMSVRLFLQIVGSTAHDKIIELLGAGGAVPFTYDLPMIKTEQGWQIAK